MRSPGHRGNILGSYAEFGSGMSFGDAGNGALWSYATEDFGSRAPIPPIPTLPAGAVIPRLAFATDARELIVNYYDQGGQAPRSVKALVGSACVNLTKVAGSASNGSYGTTRTFPTDGCTPVVFEAIAADGTRHRWPDNRAIVVGTGWDSVDCDEFTNAVPTQNCGGGSGPLPTPTPQPSAAPAPTPAGNTQLKQLRVVLKPGQANASKGLVQVQGTLPPMPSFDPSSAPVSFRVRFGHNGDWATTFAARCGDGPCLKPNSRSTVYTGKVGSSTVTFTRAQNEQWKLRLSSRDQTLSGLSAGPVTVTVQVDDGTHTGSADGKMKDNGLVAN